MRKIITTAAFALAAIAMSAPAHADSGDGSASAAPAGNMGRTLLCALTSITGTGDGVHFDRCVNADPTHP
ncbi:hypothetical protein [Streptomyces sp. FXJ1.172]|uniref:hypothetical protein n=1 Tax=Streptomyces sp. FXJ1.172 TaxID=710705 RepID=UPI0013318B2B|nr:hypothetical protein [Streptomyces sp. FXJ1.172]WEO99818.1 hypothetical protein A6P39_040485 [Streptomyces sp. FXJ1.172]